MSNVIESLKGTLQRGRTIPIGNGRIKGSDEKLNDEMDQLEKLVADGIVKLRTAVRDGQAAAADAARHAENVIESLKTEIGELETRDKEVDELKSKINVLEKLVTQQEAAMRQVKAHADEEAKRARNLAALEAQVREREEIDRAKDLTFKGLERDLNAKIQELENQLKNKDRLLADKDRQMDDLNSQLTTLTNRIKGMSSFFKQAEALATVETRNVGEVVPVQSLKTTEPQHKNSEVVSKAADAAPQTLSRQFFDHVTSELAEVLGPFSLIIVRDHVRALGESMETFPTARVMELVEILSKEIADEKLKVRFCERVVEKL
jgi:DNA repair exonuclease SbcCD ATPase subunit